MNSLDHKDFFMQIWALGTLGCQKKSIMHSRAEYIMVKTFIPITRSWIEHNTLLYDFIQFPMDKRF